MFSLVIRLARSMIMLKTHTHTRASPLSLLCMPRVNHEPNGVERLTTCTHVKETHSTPLKRTQTHKQIKMHLRACQLFFVLWSQTSSIRHAQHRGLSVPVTTQQSPQKKNKPTMELNSHRPRTQNAPTSLHPSHESIQLSRASKSTNRQGAPSLYRYPDHIHTHRSEFNTKLSFKKTMSY